MTNFTIGQKYVTAPRNTWTGVEKIPLDVSGSDGVGLASTLRTYVNTGQAPLSAIRTKLTADQTYFVTTTGNDTTGDGTAGLPWASPQHAYDYVCANIDLAGFRAIIQIAAGTYAPLGAGRPVIDLTSNIPVSFDTVGKGPSSPGVVLFQGQVADQTLVKLQNGNGSPVIFGQFSTPGFFFFKCMQLIETSGTVNVVGLKLPGSQIFFENVDIGGGGSTYTDAQFNVAECYVQIQGTYTILSGMTTGGYHLRSTSAAVIQHSATVNIPAPVDYHDGGFVTANDSSFVFLSGIYNNLGNFTGNKIENYAGTVNLQSLKLSQIYGAGIIVGWGQTGLVEFKSDEGLLRGNVFGVEFKVADENVNTSDLPSETWGLFRDEVNAFERLYYSDGAVAPRPLTRMLLRADHTFYVATTGNDTTGTGTATNPWLTPQHAWDWICDNVDRQGHAIIVQMAAGTYTPPGGLTDGTPVLDMTFRGMMGTSDGSFGANPHVTPITFKGQSDRTLVRFYQPSTGDAAGNCVRIGSYQVVDFDSIQFWGVNAGGTTGFLVGGDAIYSSTGFISCDVGPASGSHFFAGDFTRMAFSGTYSILGSTRDNHFSLGLESYVSNFASIAIPSPITVSNTFLTVGNGGFFAHFGTFTGSANVTGQKFVMEEGAGYESTQGLLATCIPGTVAGITYPMVYSDILVGSDVVTQWGGINTKGAGGLPTTTQMEDQSWSIWKNLTDGRVYLVVRDGAAIKKVELV